MNLREGQVFEGRISLSGEDGPLHRWLVIAPFGKIHAHSIDDPLETHSWPASSISEGLSAQRVRLVDYNPDHVVIRLQRAKEARDIRDTELGLPRDKLEAMLALMKEALVEDCEMALYAAGEIIELLQRTPLPKAEAKAIERHIGNLLKRTGDIRNVPTH